MLKVKVRKIGAAMIGAASLVAAGKGAVGCAADAVDTVDRVSATFDTDSASSALTVVNPGEATLSLGHAYYGGQRSFVMNVQNATTDEFVRVGQKLTLDLPGQLIWQRAHPTEWTMDASRMGKLKVAAKAHFFRGPAQVGEAALGMSGWTGSETWDLVVSTESFVVPEGVDRVEFSVDVTDDEDSSIAATIGVEEILPVQVFGADLPGKHVLFDNDGTSLRTRVIEGGNPVRGAGLTLGYTDYRANTVVDSYGIDRKIGEQKGSGRFGPMVYPIYGELQHEVTVGVYFDDATGWRGEVPMVGRPDSELLGSGRISFEKQVMVPANASKMSVYFHVKTYLLVDYSRYPNATEKYFQQGERILVADKWDNPSGAGTNYDMGIEDTEPNPDVKRTVVFIKGETAPGQDMFIRGGIDHAAARELLGIECAKPDGNPNYACAIPIVHRNHRNATTDAWKIGDNLLDWYGVQTGQTALASGIVAAGSPADWTTNLWPESFGPTKRVAVDGYGLESLNAFGMHYWMLDVEMDCSRAYTTSDGTGWFEVKSFITNGPGWEADVKQPGTPYASNNHFAQCGRINVFARGESAAQFHDFE
jgi:hypothetical protein